MGEISIRSDRLTIKIALPGTPPNTTFRFDRAGFITSAVLDGVHEFCTAEPDNLSHPCTGGVGLCSEVGSLSTAADAAVGDRFAKFGVGLLLKPDDEPYVRFREYNCDPFHITYETTDDSTVFYTSPRPCGGYALKQLKTVSVRENMLSVKYTVENSGEKALSLREYCHNFITIDRLPLGPDYRLEIPTLAKQDGKKPREEDGTIYGEGSGFSFTGYCPAAASVSARGDEIDPSRPFSWKLTNRRSPASISEATSFIPSTVLIWCIDHIISPEIIHTFTLRPEEQASWSRIWTFERSS